MDWIVSSSLGSSIVDVELAIRGTAMFAIHGLPLRLLVDVTGLPEWFQMDATMDFQVAFSERIDLWLSDERTERLAVRSACRWL